MLVGRSGKCGGEQALFAWIEAKYRRRIVE
jgi:hypothetical protein